MTKKMLKKKFLIEQGKQEERERIIKLIENWYEDLCFVGRCRPKINDCNACNKKLRDLIKKMEEAGK